MAPLEVIDHEARKQVAVVAAQQSAHEKACVERMDVITKALTDANAARRGIHNRLNALIVLSLSAAVCATAYLATHGGLHP